MTLLQRLASVLRWLAHRNRAEQDLNDEVQAFVDMAAADKVRNGALSSEARRMAILDRGGIEQTKERVRIYRHGALLRRCWTRRSICLPHLRQTSRLHVRRRAHAGAGYRRQYGDLQPDRCADAPMAAGAKPAGAGAAKFRTADARGPAAESFSYPIVGTLAEQTDI